MRKRVAVVGVGTLGSQVLRLLALDQDIEAVGFEGRTLGHPFGAAGGEGRIFRRVLGLDGEGWSELSARSYAAYGVLEAELGVELRSFTGSVTVGRFDDPELQRIDDEAVRMGSRVEHLEPKDLRRLFPFQEVRADDRGILEREGGIFRPELINLLTARRATELGADVRTGTRVLDIVERPGGVRVETASGAEDFDQVIVTTGAWALELAPELRGTVAIHKPVSAWFAPRSGAVYRPMTGFMRTANHQYYGLPDPDGRMVKLGWAGTQQTPIDVAPSPADQYVSDEELQGFAVRLAEHFPQLDPEPLRVNAYFEGYVATGRPVLGRISDRMVVAAGMSGWGFTLGPAYAEALAAIVRDIDPPADISFLTQPCMR